MTLYGTPNKYIKLLKVFVSIRIYKNFPKNRGFWFYLLGVSLTVIYYPKNSENL